MRHLLMVALVWGVGCDDSSSANAPRLDHLQGEIAGEPTHDAVLLQSRLTTNAVLDGDVSGMDGVARFEVSEDPSFAGSITTAWMTSDPERDHIVRARIEELSPGTRHHYRLWLGESEDTAVAGPVRSFRTLPGPDAVASTTFAAVSCMHYGRFRRSPRGMGPDRELGFPALDAIREAAPDFWVSTGDSVYYDHDPPVSTLDEMRRKWHEQLVQPRFVDLFSEMATFWMKDDHDHRFDDSDPFAEGEPSHELGVRVFREQAPVRPEGDDGPSWRTHRISRLLQLWFLEGRDHRSANDADPGPAKTLWGDEQRAWLMDGLLASDATFRIVVSPTPMVGPDDVFKRDNHVNENGFRDEGDAFFTWLVDNGLVDQGLFLVVGDRHWQYHSAHPSGVHELGTGALVDGNARMGRAPGDPLGTDPDALVDQRFTSPEPTGGFLLVRVDPDATATRATIAFEHRDEDGRTLYTYEDSRAIE